MNPQLLRASKFLSLVLRHDPGRIGLVLDPEGWAEIEVLLAAAQAHGVALDRATLERVVAENDKQRFALSDDGTRIRASQGHSIAVDLALVPVVPPERLYHGTATRFLDAIRREGLDKRSRQHVHLSPDAATATTVGQRHGKAVVLIVRAGVMHTDGHHFYRSANGVWLTAHVPPQYLLLPGEEV
jgi:putative RNA 2'-phosphotransferase